MNRSEEASNLFLQWLKDNLEAPESAQVQADLRTCQAIIAQNREWLAGPALPCPLRVDRAFSQLGRTWASLDNVENPSCRNEGITADEYL